MCTYTYIYIYIYTVYISLNHVIYIIYLKHVIARKIHILFFVFGIAILNVEICDISHCLCLHATNQTKDFFMCHR